MMIFNYPEFGLAMTGSLERVWATIGLVHKKPSSIIATRYLVETFTAYGIEAIPMVVRCMVFNEKCHQLSIESEGLPKDEAGWGKWVDQGAYAVKVGFPPQGAGGANSDGLNWFGHLVTLLVDLEVVLDPAIIYAMRPTFGIKVKHLVIWADGLLLGDVQTHINSPGSSVVHYFPSQFETSYIQTRDWADVRLNDTALAQVSKELGPICQSIASSRRQIS